MNSQEIWSKYGQEIYFFILKKVNDDQATNDIFQNTFFKIHKNLHQLNAPDKIRAWAFQICRNEITNFYKVESIHNDVSQATPADDSLPDVCCLDKFIDNLPDNYRETIELIYRKGKKQKEVAEILGMSLANVKAVIRRSKELLKKQFLECCQYKTDKKGNLVGLPDCPTCS